MVETRRYGVGLIDLHSHTNESDGSYTPAELVQASADMGLEALAVTDHDTFAGYDLAVPHAGARDLDLICGIELSTKFATGLANSKTVHVLAYFIHQPPSVEFRGWVLDMQRHRRERNVRLIANLNKQGVAIDLAEVEAMGRSLAGRPHFAKILIQKGYAHSTEHAFRDFLGETAPGFVERESPDLPLAVQHVIAGGGIPVCAHPIRLGYRDHAQEEACISDMRDAGLLGLEVYHSDHGLTDVNRYRAIAKKYGLIETGGSDFHGHFKPKVSLGTGIAGNVNVPLEVLKRLRARPLP